ncbi:DUF4303 domain-containing protein [Lysinibacillus sp. FSL H8-0500]|uniref:DUF4303 domain-containing protein n=1 Tax=Lysinibacillus sp. FSL H8-0500 TaxID=2921393 RepID=UPI0031018B7F
MAETQEIEELANKIAYAARKSFLELFKNGERFYYCTFFTTGEGHAPSISAWSWEALTREANKQAIHSDRPAPEMADLIKWSYADSPYYCFGEENFADVYESFAKRPFIWTLENEEWHKELMLRLQAMEIALKMLDEEGLFSLNQPRDAICITVEIMPPEEINSQIALRLNNPSSPALQQWLAEAAE